VGISKRYGGVQALRDVSVAVPRATVLGIVGENGAGKSTLVKILSGLEQPDSGTIRVDSEVIAFNGPRDAQRVGIRIAPQELVLCPDLSVTENLLMGELPVHPSRPRVVAWNRAHEEAERRLKLLGVQGIDVRANLSTLSVVERAFVQLAHAMDPQTQVLIADEPTAPMSGAEVEQTLAVLTEIRRAGVAVIYVSHRLQEVFQLCDRVIVLRDGRTVRSFERGEFDTSGLVSAMVSGRTLDLRRSDRRTGHGGTPALEARDVEAGVLQGIALRVDRGELVAVYGTLGSGRDELAPTLLGRIGKVGELRIDGRRVRRSNAVRLTRAGVGYVPAERRSQGLILERSIRENLTLGMLRALTRLGIMRRRAERLVAARWRDSLQIASPSIEVPVGALSGGSQQKVMIARWLASQSHLLILEEPTRGVDIATKAEIYRVLENHTESGGAALIISSDLEEVARIADRVIVVREGEIVGELGGASETEIARLALGSTDKTS
jgi:L-arabinose transport system ATP-binding protein